MMMNNTNCVRTKKEILFHGIPASPGIAIGPVFLAKAKIRHLENNTARTITEDQVDAQIELFRNALEMTRNDIKVMQSKMQSSIQKRTADVFAAHLLIVNDRMLIRDVEEMIKNQKLAADTAFSNSIQKYITVITSMQDSYFQERAGDIKDVATQIMNNLKGLANPSLSQLPEPAIVVSSDLTPSDTAMLDREKVLGFATETGSRTSHTAILARSLQLPAVVGMQHFAERLEEGDRLIIDGYMGMVIANPTEETEELYRTKMAQKEKLYAELRKESRMRAETLDGYCIRLLANAEGVDSFDQLQEYGAEGIGLFRTEFLFLNAAKLPSEEEQYQVYKKIMESLPGQPAVIRTLDVGGDKLDDALFSFREQNPFLGMRAIRLNELNPEILQTQLRAILRASAHGELKLLFPMVSSMEELDHLLELVKQTQNELRQKKIPFSKNMEIGIMIEIPSAAILAEQFARKVDFFSIGSNDLVQYSLAVDRTNERVAYLYKPSNPAILALIKHTADAARKAGIYTTVCGEIASDPVFSALLIGLGVRELSMPSASISIVRRAIRQMSFYDAEQLAQKALHCETAAEVRSLAQAYLNQAAPGISGL
ncbi:MAG: phosphoenolpyruvate--protein phosphotransferase [Lentisphaeria bacterium]|nr:phosphoenolpyruvate--protein phosphotransferase [Lentisphaeria bacterium]